MRQTFTFDPAAVVLFLPLVVLLMVGVVPFTAFWVGLTLLASTIHATITWER